MKKNIGLTGSDQGVWLHSMDSIPLDIIVCRLFNSVVVDILGYEIDWGGKMTNGEFEQIQAKMPLKRMSFDYC